MKYKKPQIVAQSAPKTSYVANCPPKTFYDGYCSSNRSCMCGDGTR